MTSKPYLAIVLIVIGLLAFVYQGINYTTREKPVVIGPIEITTEKTHRIPLPPIIGAVTLLVGIGLLFRQQHHSS
jgi:uncharacterized membrane protein YdcZ (DUF606 family)